MQKILIKEMEVTEDKTKLKMETKVISHFKIYLAFANTKQKDMHIISFYVFGLFF